MKRTSRSLRAVALSLSAAAALATPFAAGVSQPALAQAVRGHGDSQAEAFVQTEANRVISVLGDRSMPLAAKRQTFRRTVDEVADVPRITSFVLGKYRRSVSPAQYAAFSEAFREYANNVYESRLGQYHGQQLRVTGSVVRRPGDVIVASQITGAGEAPSSRSLVNWRVLRGDDGRFRIVDVQAAGVWLAITEQQDFVSTLDNAGGNVDALIQQLRIHTERQRAAARG